MSICKKITNLLEGDIIVQSAKGMGCKFTFYVSADLNPNSTDLVAIKESLGVGSATRQLNSVGNGAEDLPSEFSHLVNRMHQVFQQFKSRVEQDEAQYGNATAVNDEAVNMED